MQLADGIATLRQLRARGIRDARVRTALRRGDLIRVRAGVVATPGCGPEVLAAARVGGRLAGASAARYHGFWSPVPARLVVEIPRGAHAGDPIGRVIRGAPGPARYGVCTVEELIPQVLRTEAVPVAVAVLDSILRRSPLTRTDLEVICAALPRALRRVIQLVDPRAESGTESIVRVLLAEVGIHASPQVRVPFTDLQRLDLVVGDRLVIECDSRAHHATPDELDRDAERDLALTALGFLVIRIRYRALSDPLLIVAAVQRLVDAGLHLDGSAPSRRDSPVSVRRPRHVARSVAEGARPATRGDPIA